MEKEDLSQLSIIFPLKVYFVICCALLYHDFFLTLQAEMERFWSLKLSFGSFFFFLSRYFVVIGYAPVMWEFFGNVPISTYVLNDRCHKITNSHPRCSSMKKYHDLFAGASQVIVSTLMIMRTYALYAKSRKVLAFLVSIGLVTLALGLWAILSRSIPAEQSNLPGLECFPSMIAETAYRFIAAWSGVVVLDAAIFTLTLNKAVRMRKVGLTGFLGVMLRDGTIYFALITMANVSNILTYAFGGVIAFPKRTTLTNVLSSLMMTRLMLNIRDPKLHNAQPISTELQTPVFANGTLTYPTYQTRTESIEHNDKTLDMGASPWNLLRSPEAEDLEALERGFVTSPLSVGDTPTPRGR